MVEFKFTKQNINKIDFNTSGVYAIRNDLSGDMYVGHSSNIKQRAKGHYYSIKNNACINVNLQKAIDKIGIDKFSFIILETCDDVKDTLKYLENKYIEEYGTYNITSVDGKRVYCYDKQGNFVAEYVNIKHAAKAVNGHPDNIRAAIDNRKKSYRGFQWSYIKVDQYKPYVLNTYKYPEKQISVSQYDLNGNYITTHKSLHDMERATGFQRGPIKKAIKKENGKAYGYIWKAGKLTNNLIVDYDK